MVFFPNHSDMTTANIFCKIHEAISSGGSRIFRWGGGDADLRRVHFSAKTYAKMKEMDPVGVGGGARAGSTPPGSTTD